MSFFWKREKAEKQEVLEQDDRTVRLADNEEKDVEEKTMFVEKGKIEKTMSMEEYYRIYGAKKGEENVCSEKADGRRSYIDPVAVVLAEQEKRQKEQNSLQLTRIPVEKKEHIILEPVGWLICIAGSDFGKSFPLKKGKNHVGRSAEMEIVLDDHAISRRDHAWIEYKEEERIFYVCAGEARNLVYLNDDLLLMPAEMKKNDVLELGDSRLMLIPCCDRFFSWEDARE